MNPYPDDFFEIQRNQMNYDEIADMIKRHEGFSESIYSDSKGILTVGWGCVLKPGFKLPIKCLFSLFNDRYNKAINDCRLCEIRFGVELDSIRKAVIIDMCYCLGRKGTMAFTRMWAAIQIGDFKEASKQILDSQWHRDLETIRARRPIKTRTMELSEMMRVGEDEI